MKNRENRESFPPRIFCCIQYDSTEMSHDHIINVIWHEKTVLMYTKYTPSHYFNYLTFCKWYTSSVNFKAEAIVCCIGTISFIGKLCLITKLRNLSQKSGQISCAHKHRFLMPGHKCHSVCSILDYSMSFGNIINENIKFMQSLLDL